MKRRWWDSRSVRFCDECRCSQCGLRSRACNEFRTIAQPEPIDDAESAMIELLGEDSSEVVTSFLLRDLEVGLEQHGARYGIMSWSAAVILEQIQLPNRALSPRVSWKRHITMIVGGLALVNGLAVLSGSVEKHPSLYILLLPALSIFWLSSYCAYRLLRSEKKNHMISGTMYRKNIVDRLVRVLARHDPDGLEFSSILQDCKSSGSPLLGISPDELYFRVKQSAEVDVPSAAHRRETSAPAR
jgi:hypothetical protein